MRDAGATWPHRQAAGVIVQTIGRADVGTVARFAPLLAAPLRCAT